MDKTPSAMQTLVLGGGCFWCTEAVYVEVKGVLDVESGYSNGHAPQPSYEQVCSGSTGHNEVVKLIYDPAQVSTREFNITWDEIIMIRVSFPFLPLKALMSDQTRVITITQRKKLCK